MPHVAPECEPGFHDVKLKVGLIEGRMSAQEKVLDKITEAVGKTQEMNANMCKLIALHDLRHESHEKFQDEVDDEVKALHSRITTSGREGDDKLTMTERDLIQRMDALRLELSHGQRKHTSPSPYTSELSRSVKDLEKWKYIFIGGVFLLGWILAHIKWSVFASLFGG